MILLKSYKETPKYPFRIVPGKIIHIPLYLKEILSTSQSTKIRHLIRFWQSINHPLQVPQTQTCLYKQGQKKNLE